mgnify:CR=1 FL=1
MRSLLLVLMAKPTPKSRAGVNEQLSTFPERFLQPYDSLPRRAREGVSRHTGTDVSSHCRPFGSAATERQSGFRSDHNPETPIQYWKSVSTSGIQNG